MWECPGGLISACLLPNHASLKALMRHQLSLQHLEPQYFCTLRPLVWNVPCCPPDEVLPPSFCPGLGPAGLLSAPCPSPGGRYGSSLSSQNPRQVLKTSLHLSVSVSRPHHGVSSWRTGILPC